jgi:hypothetical protein
MVLSNQNVLWKSYHDEKIMNMKHIYIYIYRIKTFNNLVSKWLHA